MKTKFALDSAKRSDAAIQMGGSYRKCSIRGMFINTSNPNKDYIKRNIEETSGFSFFLCPRTRQQYKRSGEITHLPGTHQTSPGGGSLDISEPCSSDTKWS